MVLPGMHMVAEVKSRFRDNKARDASRQKLWKNRGRVGGPAIPFRVKKKLNPCVLTWEALRQSLAV